MHKERALSHLAAPHWPHFATITRDTNSPGRSLSARLRQLVDPRQQVTHDYILTRWLFLRLLGVVYLVAFASLWPQIPGLIGRNGILPAGEFLASVWAPTEAQRFLLVPTLAWFNASDGFLLFMCGAGVVLSVLLILGVLPIPVLSLLWALYLSLFSVGQVFLGYQWDVLLLETGFLAIFFAPLQVLPGVPREAPPSRIVLWLFRLLAFRLMFFSGVVKVASGDPTWRNLTALSFHYETQPLPTPLAWYAHQLPLWFHTLSSAMMFLIELLVPFLIFAPRRPRLVGAGLLASLQVLIMLTGNYAFFNLLSIVLCVLLLNDTFLRRFIPLSLRDRLASPERAARPPRMRRWLAAPLAALVLFLSVVQVIYRYIPGVDVPRPALEVAQHFTPFHIVNSYGLFAVMTTSRPEIIVEGSNDGKTWLAYGFAYKPGDLERTPGWVAPHQPRLDWQMWFAALTPPWEGQLSYGWFDAFMLRLLQGSPEVLALLESNPFPDAPPRYIRAQLYNYQYTNGGNANGAWWQRELEGMYFPPTTLRDRRWQREVP
ncbi:MAG TPA: lipase maturation factor family protein [Chloroflexia bacterium]|jgi:hypothetical protein